MKSLLFILLEIILASTAISQEPNTYLCDDKTIINSIEFITEINLGFSDLAYDTGLKEGEACNLFKIDYAINKLKQRNIFEKISYRLVNEGNGLKLSFDLIPFLILSEVEFEGNNSILSSELQRSSGIKIGNHIFSEDIRESEKRIKKLYNDNGFPNASVESRLIADRTTPLVSLEFEIDEGPEVEIKEILFDQEIASKFDDIVSDLRAEFVGQPLKKGSTSNIKKFVYSRFANKSYYKASIFVDVVDYELGKIFVHTELHDKMEIVIQGAYIFTNKTLLDKLELDKRSVPITETTLLNWCNDIRILYWAQGYLDADVTCGLEALDHDRFVVKIMEGGKYKEPDFNFSGNSFYLENELSSHLNSKLTNESSTLFGKKLVYLENDLPLLESELTSEYIKNGYLDVSITSEFRKNKDDFSTKINFNINEGDQFKVNKVIFSNAAQYASELDTSDLEELTSNIEGDIYRPDIIASELLDFESKYLNKGFSDFKFTPHYDKQSQNLVLDITIAPKIKIRQIHFGGNYFTVNRIISRELKFVAGDYLNQNILDDSRRALLGLGIFRSVEIYPVSDGLPANECDIQVMVKESETGIAEGLTELSTQDGLHLQGQVGQRNLFGTGRALVFSVDSYFKEQGIQNFDAARARAAYGSPKLFGSFLDYQLEGFIQTNLNFNRNFKYNRVGVTNSLKFPFLEELRFNLSHTYYTEKLFDVQPDIEINSRDTGSTIYSAIRSNIEYDKRDDPFVPTKGFRLEFGGSVFPSALGSEVPMTEGHAQFTNLTPLGNFWTYATNLKGALTRASGNYDSVPLGSRYFIGGRDSLRGYTRFQVGPRSQSGYVAGGDTVLTFSQEARYQISNQLIGLLFVDFGQSFLVQKADFTGDTKNQFSSFKISPGFGTQYLTPIGPLGFEVGFATDKEFGERWGRVLVSIGSAF